ncbi:AMP-binding protein [Streptomyces sp. NPDC051909]|uniref:class I adenylate-forming enzyme family protein n=1 Tax=Streptomyces sp. NPDC051909 TaxID=3154944 RepID=UPI00343FD0A8
MADLGYLPWHRPAVYDDLPCVRDDRHDLTYAEFAAWVDAVAEQFAEYGVGPGSVVAVMLPNRVELLVSLVAAWRLGAAVTPINPVFTANEADYQIADADAALVVNLGPEAPSAGRTSLAVDDLRRAAAGTVALPEHSTKPDHLALLIYTSGSTGRPKGVMLDHAHLDAMASMMAGGFGVTGQDHCLLVLPLFHVNAICVSFLTPMTVGGRLSLLERFHPERFLDAVRTLRPTYFSAVPTIYAHLVSLPEDVAVDTSSVRVAICGAAPASKELLEAAESRFGFPVVEGYGLTEGTCASTVNPLQGVRKPGTVGLPLPGQAVRIMAPDGSFLPAGQRGEVVIQGPNVMRGYLNRPEATEETLRDGWLHTGDVGVLDEDGYLRIVDRIKDMIIRGGENIYPKEIEAVLHGCPGVLEAAVVGSPHPVYGEVPAAYVTAYPDTALDLDALTEHCRTHLTKVKVPAVIHRVDALPRNPVGKIDKPALRARGSHIPAPSTTGA